MEYTEEQKASFKRQFSAKRRKQIIVAVPLIAVIILLALAGEESEKVVLGMSTAVWVLIAALIIVAGVVFSLYNWRCPACNKYLGKAMSPKFCVKCGVALS